MKNFFKKFISLLMTLTLFVLALTGCDTRNFRAQYLDADYKTLQAFVNRTRPDFLMNYYESTLKGSYATVSNEGNEVLALEENVTFSVEKKQGEGEVKLKTRYIDIVEDKSYEVWVNKGVIYKDFASGKIYEPIKFTDETDVAYFPPELKIFFERFKKSVLEERFPLDAVKVGTSVDEVFLRITVNEEVAKILFFETQKVTVATGEIFLVQNVNNKSITNFMLRFNVEGDAPDIVTRENCFETISADLYYIKV